MFRSACILGPAMSQTGVCTGIRVGRELKNTWSSSLSGWRDSKLIFCLFPVGAKRKASTIGVHMFTKQYMTIGISWLLGTVSHLEKLSMFLE